MTSGRLIAVVGASGVGKDSVINGILQAAPGLTPVRRSITRPADPDGENHEVAQPDSFDLQVAQGAFCLHWSAHECSYGIPVEVLAKVRQGEQCLANISRNSLSSAASQFPAMTVLNITVEASTLANRLALRGRETNEEITSRLERVVTPIPSELDVYNISNDGPLAQTIAQALDALGLDCATSCDHAAVNTD